MNTNVFGFKGILFNRKDMNYFNVYTHRLVSIRAILVYERHNSITLANSSPDSRRNQKDAQKSFLVYLSVLRVLVALRLCVR